MPTRKCEWCKDYHDIRPDRCREIQQVQQRLESLNPAIREVRIRERLRELETEKYRVRAQRA